MIGLYCARDVYVYISAVPSNFAFGRYPKAANYLSIQPFCVYPIDNVYLLFAIGDFIRFTASFRLFTACGLYNLQKGLTVCYFLGRKIRGSLGRKIRGSPGRSARFFIRPDLFYSGGFSVV